MEAAMTSVWGSRAVENKVLVLDLLQWVEKQPRTYNEVMEAWRTSCQRLPIWEEAVDLGSILGWSLGCIGGALARWSM